MTNIHPSWDPILHILKSSLKELLNVKGSVEEPLDIFPPENCKLFEMDIKEIRVVILGQDPYYNEGQADGFSFSVPNNQVIPPSLKNIFKEIMLEFPDRNYKFTSGNLKRWFYDQKIFLLNSALTVESKKPGTLWSKFTNSVLQLINKQNDKVVFLCMGAYAKNISIKVKSINKVFSAHPSPQNRGFFNSDIFKKTEELLGYEINWQN